MNEQLLAVIFGIIGGVAGGMGMGGGTLLVPLLSWLQLEQRIIQAINLISFLPMSIIAVFIHNKHKLIAKNVLLPCIIPTIISGTLGSLLASSANNSMLRICFAVYLILVGIWQIVLAVISFRKAHLRKKHSKKVVRCQENLPLKKKVSIK